MAVPGGWAPSRLDWWWQGTQAARGSPASRWELWGGSSCCAAVMHLRWQRQGSRRWRGGAVRSPALLAQSQPLSPLPRVLGGRPLVATALSSLPAAQNGGTGHWGLLAPMQGSREDGRAACQQALKPAAACRGGGTVAGGPLRVLPAESLEPSCGESRRTKKQQIPS